MELFIYKKLPTQNALILKDLPEETIVNNKWLSE